MKQSTHSAMHCIAMVGHPLKQTFRRQEAILLSSSNSLPRGSRGSILQIHLIISGCFANFQLRYFFTQFATKNIEKVSLRTEHTRPCLYFCKLKSRQFIPNGERLWHVPAFQPFESVTTL